VAEPTANLIAHDRLADRPAHDESHLGLLINASSYDQVADKQRPADPATTPGRGGEVRPAAHPGGCGKHRAPPSRHCTGQTRAGQTLTRARPLRRRAASTARPARVRMRSRNPCVFARRRLFGWNVRLLTETPGESQSPRRQPSGVTTTTGPTPVTPKTRLAHARWTDSAASQVASKARPAKATLTSHFSQASRSEAPCSVPAGTTPANTDTHRFP